MMGASLGMEMAPPELHPDVWRGQNFFYRTHFTVPNNTTSIKYALESVLGLADVGAFHRDGNGPITPAPKFG